MLYFLFFNDPPTTEIYTLSLHDALPICVSSSSIRSSSPRARITTASSPNSRLVRSVASAASDPLDTSESVEVDGDRKSTRLNSSHANISYAVFCLKKKKRETDAPPLRKT